LKKAISLVLAVIFFTTQVYADEINVSINEQKIIFTDQAPAVVDGRTLVPVRSVFEHIGFDVDWEEETRTVTLIRENDEIIIAIDSDEFITNGRTHRLDVPAQVINDRTMLPIRAVLASVGYNVDWDEESSTVLVYSNVQMRIPDRRLTADEIEDWISNYNALGGGTEFEREVIRLVNIERAEKGLRELEEYTPLMMASRFKAQSMYDLGYFNHTSPIYGHFANISQKVFGISPRSMGENLANGHRTPETVVRGWMESEGHRANILNPAYRRIGVGFYNFRWAQKFSV